MGTERDDLVRLFNDIFDADEKNTLRDAMANNATANVPYRDDSVYFCCDEMAWRPIPDPLLTARPGLTEEDIEYKLTTLWEFRRLFEDAVVDLSGHHPEAYSSTALALMFCLAAGLPVGVVPLGGGRVVTVMRFTG